MKFNIGDRVMSTTDLMTSEGNAIREGEKGMVVGHRGNKPVIGWDHRGYAAEYSTVEPTEVIVVNRKRP